MKRTLFRTRTAALRAACLTAGLMATMPSALAQSAPPTPTTPTTIPSTTTPSLTDSIEIPSPLELARLPEAVIAHRDGRQIQGEILAEDNYRLILNLDGLRTEVLRVDINSVRRLPPAMDRYETIRKSIPVSDVESRLALVEWLRRRKLYTPALAEVGVALGAEPGNPSALRMRTWLEAQIRMQQMPAVPARDAAGRAQALDVIRARAGRQTPKADLPTLTEAQINRIRVYEVDLDNPPRMVVSRETLKRLFTAYGASPLLPQTKTGRDALARRPAHEILELMFKLKAREMYPEIRVLSDPESLKTFRDRIHGRGGWLINSCGSVRCHGGTESGTFQLVTRRAFSDEAVYTNFFILDNYKLADGTGLINYDEPNQSPLLLMATRRDQSSRPHPETQAKRGPLAWRPIFNSTSDPKFRQATSWIRSLYRPRPDYGIDYALPGQAPDDSPGAPSGPFAGPSDNPSDTPVQSPPQPATPTTPEPDPESGLESGLESGPDG